MIEQQKNLDTACFEVNESGRILSSNRRFCRMFGFEESEIVWHYITDFYRHRFGCGLDHLGQDLFYQLRIIHLTQHHFVARMRNRKGRSFKCSITREVVQDAEGRVSFKCFVSKLGDAESVKIPEVSETAKSMVFVVKCAHCGNQVRVNTLAETRMRVLCDYCAAKAYPDAFNLKTAQM